MCNAISFLKYHGCGNDFIICEYNKETNYNELVPNICNRYIGIGADTFIAIKKEKPYQVWFYNADGTEAPMCGNGIRCAAAFLKDNGYVTEDIIEIKTYSGIRKVYYLENNLFEINMGKPSYKKEDIDLEYNKEELFNESFLYNKKYYNISALFFTTHHLVVLVDNLDVSEDEGKYFCEQPMFKKKINVDFVKIINDETIQMITYERGCGFTKACGSGATSSVAVLNRRGLVKDKVKVLFEYGALTISKRDEQYYMSGPAKLVASNIIYHK